MSVKEELYRAIREILGLVAEEKILGVTIKTQREETHLFAPEGEPVVNLERGPYKPKREKHLFGGPHKKKGGGRPPNLKTEIFTRDYNRDGDTGLTIIRQQLNKWKYKKKLKEDEILAMSSLGRSIKKMTSIQKGQLLNIFEAVRKRIKEAGDGSAGNQDS